MHVVILGNGVAGVTAALRLRELQPGWRITLVSGESRHHFSRPALMYVFMGHMRYEDTKPFEDGFWAEQRLELVRDWVTHVDVEARRLTLHRGEPLRYDQLLVATGSKPNRFGWPGQDLDGVQGLYGLMDLKRLYDTVPRVRSAVVVGGGLIGIELAEMLHTRGIHVTFLVRERSYWDNVLPAEESGIVNDVIRAAGFELLLGAELDEILGDAAGRVRGVRTKDGRELACELVGLTAGVSPNLDALRDSGLALGRGVLVDASLRASAPGVLAAGDCAELVRPEGERNVIQQVWYTGKQQGRVAGEVLAGQASTYEPGLWFNSAKFLDVEYQVYGSVGAGLAGEQNLFWRGEDGRRSARLVHVDGTVVGLQTLGVRWRHEVAERWLLARRPAADVVDELAALDFDPELTRRQTPRIQAAFRAQLR